MFALEVRFYWDTTALNRIREWLSNGFITVKEDVVDKYFLATSKAASEYILSVELSIGISFIIGAVGVVVAITIVGVGVNHPIVYDPYRLDKVKRVIAACSRGSHT